MRCATSLIVIQKLRNWQDNYLGYKIAFPSGSLASTVWQDGICAITIPEPVDMIQINAVKQFESKRKSCRGNLVFAVDHLQNLSKCFFSMVEQSSLSAVCFMLLSVVSQRQFQNELFA